ncbi:hypothetical protein BY996DRAFT_6532027 [Phakopsora pachyrhizi]|uniref:Uncharacterized protein n=1 Tax=Phakopsora pachyrhizi TaxID=170000 RepID=A0AAV0B2N0_PHAPC|nr:hypothetical protein BY996DRAFT_6532027 [Phakopsora pachyrhizi]CAH7676951.1 hypothetical protein PPACK8108_LOCUS12069 [Phakopsora pachyrhizi]
MTKSSLPLDTALLKTFQFIQLNYQCPFTPSDKSHVKDEADLRIEIVNQDRLVGRPGRQGRSEGREGREAGRRGLAQLCWAGSWAGWAGKGRQGQAGAWLGTGQVGQAGKGRLAGRQVGRQEDR